MHSSVATESPRAPRNRGFLLIPFAAFLLGIGATLMTARNRPEPYRGVYRQEAVEVTAETSGTILEVRAAHGNNVKPGDALAVVDDSAVSSQIDRLKTRQADLQRRIDAATARAAVQSAQRIDELEKDKLETRLRYADLLRTRFDVQVRRKALEQGEAGAVVASSASLQVRSVSAESITTSRRQIEISDAINHEEVLNTQVTLCEERLARLDLLKQNIPTQTERSLGLDCLQADLSAVDAELNTAEARSRSVSIPSPAYGRVGIYRREPGEFVAAGETLVEVFDAERPYVLLTVPVSEIAALQPGREVGVEFEGVVTRKPLRGVVADIASEAERNADAAVAPGVVVAHVRIKPSGRLWPTPPPGSTALVSLED